MHYRVEAGNFGEFSPYTINFRGLCNSGGAPAAPPSSAPMNISITLQVPFRKWFFTIRPTVMKKISMWNNKNTNFLTFSYVQNHNFFARIKLLKNAGGKTQDEKSFISLCNLFDSETIQRMILY